MPWRGEPGCTGPCSVCPGRRVASHDRAGADRRHGGTGHGERHCRSRDRQQPGRKWVNAHGTGTPLNDVVESSAMKLVFGDRALSVPLVSTKAMTGHCLGAAGAIEALATVIALNAVYSPSLNFREHDPECDLDYCHEGIAPASIATGAESAFLGIEGIPNRAFERSWPSRSQAGRCASTATFWLKQRRIKPELPLPLKSRGQAPAALAPSSARIS